MADGRSLRWAGHNEQRRAELVEAAFTAIREHGHGVGLDVIARTAGTRKPAIYRHFGERVGLYSAVTASVSARLERRLYRAAAEAGEDEAGLRDVLRAIIDAFFSLAEKDPEVYRYVVSPPQVASAVAGQELQGMSERAGELVVDLLRTRVREDDLLRTRVREDRLVVWSTALVGAVQATASTWLDQNDRRSRYDVVDDVLALLWGGIADAAVDPEDQP